MVEGATFVIVIFDKSNISRILWLSTAIEHWWIKNSSQWGYIYVIYFMYGGLYMVYGTYGICSMVVAMTIRLPTVGSWPGGSLNQIGIFPPLCIFPHFVYINTLYISQSSFYTTYHISRIPRYHK